MSEPVSLRVQREGLEAERLVGRLGAALAEEAQVTMPGPVLLGDTRVTVKFNDGRSREDAEQRVREALDTQRPDWPEFLRFD